MRTSKAIALALCLAACSGGEPGTAPVPGPDPVPTVETRQRDTAAPEVAVEDEAARARREFFEAVGRGETPEPLQPAVAAVDPAPLPAPPAPVKPVPAPVAPAPAPKPAPVVSRPAPRPVVPVPLPKPTTSVTSPAPVPAPSAATMTRPTTPAPDLGAVAEVDPTDAPPQGISEGDPLDACGDPVVLRRTASRGELPNADIACLESALGRSTSSVAREDLSVLLLTNATAAGDVSAQKDLMSRHLEEVDGGNAEIAYRYALLLMSEGPADPKQVVDLSNAALTHRAVWTGQTYEKRVYSLYKLRAAASKAALDEAVVANDVGASDATERAVYRAREDTKRYAREWYTYAEQLGMPSSSARELCLVAARSTAWCDSR